jgi:hypothetical protein
MSSKGDIHHEGLFRFSEIGTKPYKQQAVFFLNGYWHEHSKDAEKVWALYNQIIQVDPKGDKGSDLDEVQAHVFLEKNSEPMTALELRETLRKIDLNNDHRMSFLEYLMFKFEGVVKVLMSRQQEFNEMLDDNSFDKLKEQLKKSSDDLEKAKVELDKVNAEIQKVDFRRMELEALSKLDGVKGGTARAALNEFLLQDHNELNAAVLRAEALVRKARNASEHARLMLENAPHPEKYEYHSEGAVWWVERELEEVKKYKPRKNMALY